MERDDIIEYSLDAHHSEEAGVQIRKKIWKVTAILTLVTVIEVLLGVYYAEMHWLSWTAVKLIFIGLTVVKAGYIVMVFMHLGDERKSIRMVILMPYVLFILYLIFICLTESTHVHLLDSLYR
ncbi:MAG: cytochrome C oxidase subunit IV family protein [Flavobacteriales bacterium]|nr:cytochrome C oxidase subunit IV family protein [Flavobacteriales bacterium]MCB9449227.1 cytochrome C oxidase subunit IV family protein [Flavobacteriales bacterium]